MLSRVVDVRGRFPARPDPAQPEQTDGDPDDLREEVVTVCIEPRACSGSRTPRQQLFAELAL